MPLIVERDRQALGLERELVITLTGLANSGLRRIHGGRPQSKPLPKGCVLTGHSVTQAAAVSSSLQPGNLYEACSRKWGRGNQGTDTQMAGPRRLGSLTVYINGKISSVFSKSIV